MTTILVVLIILLLIGALPIWPYSRKWGYTGSSILGLLLILLIIALIMGFI